MSTAPEVALPFLALALLASASAVATSASHSKLCVRKTCELSSVEIALPSSSASEIFWKSSARCARMTHAARRSLVRTARLDQDSSSDSTRPSKLSRKRCACLRSASTSRSATTAASKPRTAHRAPHIERARAAAFASSSLSSEELARDDGRAAKGPCSTQSAPTPPAPPTAPPAAAPGKGPLTADSEIAPANGTPAVRPSRASALSASETR
eukprot:1357188-Pleurochrysis_carterae.AAC.1